MMNDTARRSVVALRVHIHELAHTASVLGTLRQGSGVIINDSGLILTIGYLINEAEEIWITTHDERIVPGRFVGFDQATGFGLVQASEHLGLPPLRLGSSAVIEPGSAVRMLDGTGAEVESTVIARQEFVGYWEYLLEEAMLLAPFHPRWDGAPVLDSNDAVIGIGSLHLQTLDEGTILDVNMVVPIDLFKPLVDDLVTIGRPRRAARPWIGVYSSERQNGVVVLHVADDGPAAIAGLAQGDIISEIDGEEVESLAAFYRKLWTRAPGEECSLCVIRSGRTIWRRVRTVDRESLFMRPGMVRPLATEAP
jgi:S1-C subfamily serine protease